MEFLISEADPSGLPPASPNSPQGLGTPATGPAGLGLGGAGSNPLGGGGGPLGGGPPPLGGGGGLGGGMPPGGPGDGGMPGTPGQIQPPTKYRASNVWEVLEKLVDGKKIGVDDKDSGKNKPNLVQSQQQPVTNFPPPQTNPQNTGIPPQPGQPNIPPAQPPETPAIRGFNN